MAGMKSQEGEALIEERPKPDIFKTTVKYTALVLITLALIALGYIAWAYTSGCKYMVQEEYDEAVAEFVKIPLPLGTNKAIACYMAKAEKLYSQGDLEGAQAIYASLDRQGEANQIREDIVEAEYKTAEALASSGKLVQASEAFLEIKDYKDSVKRHAECLDTQYRQAVAEMYAGRWENAKSLFDEIGAYMDSNEMSVYCEQRIRSKETYGETKLLTDNSLCGTFKNGFLYKLDFAYVYVPLNINSDTASCIYYPGGTGDYMLYAESMVEYLEKYSPNTVIIFLFESGYMHQLDMNMKTAKLMYDCSLELNIVIHDLAVIGTSNGAYTAMRMIPYIYETYGIKAKSLSTYDTGVDWAMPFLDEEELNTYVEVSPALYLFEQRGVDDDTFTPIKKFVDSGLSCSIIECADGRHDAITKNAFSYGALSFATGELETLDESQYTIKSLTNSQEGTN